MLQNRSRNTWVKLAKKHVSKAGKVDPGDGVTLPVKFACKPELTLNHLLCTCLAKTHKAWREGGAGIDKMSGMEGGRELE